MEAIQTYWNEILRLIEEESSAVSFDTWFRPIIPYGINENRFYLHVDDYLPKDMLEKRYFNLLQNAVKQVTKKDYDIVILVGDEKPTITEEPQAEVKPNPNIPRNLNPKYVFNSFVVGNSNRMAHAASLAVAEAPARNYNPLFLYGNSGLGKTHLMHSIAHYILDQNHDTKVLYVTSETFTNELILSIQNNKNEGFRDKYRNIDVLLIDDIQFISKKEGTQEEFFHTFNALYESTKQIIISSDRPPKEIETLEDRLRSRFEMGLIADIQQPDYETRIAILRKKTERDQLQVPDDVMAYIAKNIASNIRELEGALTRIVAYATLTNQDITISLAETALKDIFSEHTSVPLTPELITEIIAEHYQIRVEDIQGSKKPKSIAFPRQISMYLCRKLLDISLPKIGDCFGGRDHTTVIHAITKIEKQLEHDTMLQSTILQLEKEIKERT
ncbi:chromosomal replication initiator protein DnaA [Chakrabartyella piscis]|uniref:chromosomal replication initiator protein DnaA n=1 Tax=Chakrabartyella piscis TaxID=2918914 RepID=UPI0029586E6D|nr:chromosomal replication initiator protein DnaA [Chakrabartyella piscis]